MPPVRLKIPGFKFSGLSCGIKTGSLPDLALIYSDPPAVVAGLFTNNKVQAAPVLVSKRNIRSGRCAAVVINSGNANACTGAAGMKAAELMTARTAKILKVPERQVLVSSTGKIGVPLPVQKIVAALPRLKRTLREGAIRQAARAILTTDDSVKIASVRGKIGGRTFHLVGFAKGAGMVEPHLVPHATMLAYFMTDVRIGRSLAQKIFERCAEQTFNRITVDGDTSTNDTTLLLANGRAGNAPLKEGSAATRNFEKALLQVMERLALMMVEDGEGATKCVRLEIVGAKDDAEAKKLAYTIGNSPLVRTSFFGGDPNWGRLLAAAGRSGATLNPARVTISYEGVCVARRGLSTGRVAEVKAKQRMKKGRFTVRMNLHLGRARYWIWTSDLSLDYVKLNSCYRT